MAGYISKSRSMAQSFIKSGAREGLGANSVLGALRNAGLGYRRKDFLADFRNYQRIPVQEGTMKYVGADRHLANWNYIEAPRFQRSNYSYVVNVKVHNAQTGVDFEMRTSVASDVALTRRQAVNSGLGAVSPSIDFSRLDVTRSDWENAYHLIGTAW